MRIALYGGTFDPVHVGHVELALRLRELFALDVVLFIPAHVAPHKRQANVTPALDRYAMLALATQEVESLRLSTIELDAPERPYTVDTVRHIKERLDAPTTLFFVMGADSWSEITTWYEWERLLGLINHIVVTRPGYDSGVLHVNETVRQRIVDMRGKSGPIATEQTPESDAKIYLTDALMLDVSSTDIRRAVREENNSEWPTRVPPAVADYIRKYGIYKQEYGTKFDG
jgi:nicotinate-nucleotide adenylyltransferase